MANENNPNGQDIRFIDSHYKDLFRIPDGGFIQIERPGETVVRQCAFIDEYHTRVGYEVFHICQFAEVMERNNTKYVPEPEITEEQAAWKVGNDRFLAIQTCDDGYDFTLFDDKLAEIDGGQLDNPEMSMQEIRTEILEDFKLEKRPLFPTDYDELMDKAMELEMQNARIQKQTVDTNMGKMPIEDYRDIFATQHGFDSYEDMYNQGFRMGNGMDKQADPLGELAEKLDRLAESFEPYEYRDNVTDVEANVADIKKDLVASDVRPYHKYLDMVLSESEDKEILDTAKALKSELDRVVPKKESVIDKLSQKTEKAAPTKSTHKHKEPER